MLQESRREIVPKRPLKKKGPIPSDAKASSECQVFSPKEIPYNSLHKKHISHQKGCFSYCKAHKDFPIENRIFFGRELQVSTVAYSTL